MTLEASEFLRRFLLHILPEGFVRIRHFGLFANRFRVANLALCRQLLATTEPPPIANPVPQPWTQRYQELTGGDLFLCPDCGLGRLVQIQLLPASSSRWIHALVQGDSS